MKNKNIKLAIVCIVAVIIVTIFTNKNSATFKNENVPGNADIGSLAAMDTDMLKWKGILNLKGSNLTPIISFYDENGKLDDITEIRINDKNRTPKTLHCVIELMATYEPSQYPNAKVKINKLYRSYFNEDNKEWEDFEELAMSRVELSIDGVVYAEESFKKQLNIN